MRDSLTASLFRPRIGFTAGAGFFHALRVASISEILLRVSVGRRIGTESACDNPATSMGKAAQNVFEIGSRLLEVKERLEHGQFGEWLEAEFNWGEWTAQKMMSVATKFKSVNFTDLKIAPSALYLLSSKRR